MIEDRPAFPGGRSWLVAAGSLLVLYPAAMGMWFWLSALLWGNATVYSCGGNGENVNCFGEGAYELSWMVSGVVSGLAGFGILTYSQFYNLGRWILSRPFFGDRPADGPLPYEVMLMALAAWAVLFSIPVWTILVDARRDPLGLSSVFETVFLAAIEASFLLLAFVGICRGLGWRWLAPFSNGRFVDRLSRWRDASAHRQG